MSHLDYTLTFSLLTLESAGDRDPREQAIPAAREVAGPSYDFWRWIAATFTHARRQVTDNMAPPISRH